MQSEITERAKRAWNSISDEHNQWDALSIDERETYIALTAALSDKQAGEVNAPEGWELVPKSAIMWLIGAGPDAYGNWFDKPEGAPAFWWRTHFNTLRADAAKLRSALVDVPAVEPRKFKLGDHVCKTKGSSWIGHVVGFYSTELTPVGYAVESSRERGSVQIYPEAALKLIGHASPLIEGEDSAEVSIPTGLVERCAEILEWKRTGKLPGDALRELGQSIADRLGGSLFIDNGLGQAEIATVDEALHLVVALAATRSGSATSACGGPSDAD